jgi:hypothetical protein
MMSYADLLQARDGAKATVADVACPWCASQHSDRGAKRKVLRTWFEQDGVISFNCVRCGERGQVEPDGKHHADPPPAQPDDGNERKRKIAKAADLWRKRQPITGTVAERYLRGRGIICPLPKTLGIVPAWRNVPPRMIAALGLCEEPKPGVIVPPRKIEAVHLTYLKPDGSGKADIDSPKQFRGVVVETLEDDSKIGKPIVLAPPNDLLGLAICEGIEDALSAHQATGLGAWASGGATFLPALAAVVPDCIEAVTIYAHDDKAGQDGARDLAGALDARGIEVLIEGLAS